MPMYCFLIHDGRGQPHSDPVELPNLKAARAEAVVLAGQILKDADGAFWEEGSNWRVDIADHNRLTLYSVLLVGVAAPAAALYENSAAPESVA